VNAPAGPPRASRIFPITEDDDVQEVRYEAAAINNPVKQIDAYPAIAILCPMDRPFPPAYFPLSSFRVIWAHHNTECSVNWKLQLDEKQLRKIISLCEQFLLDAAVLIFVFPVLDTLVQFGKEEITGKLIAGTLAISGVFFIGALILGMMAAKGRE
jgi:hypothetical protein